MPTMYASEMDGEVTDVKLTISAYMNINPDRYEEAPGRVVTFDGFSTFTWPVWAAVGKDFGVGFTVDFEFEPPALSHLATRIGHYNVAQWRVSRNSRDRLEVVAQSLPDEWDQKQLRELDGGLKLWTVMSAYSAPPHDRPSIFGFDTWIGIQAELYRPDSEEGKRLRGGPPLGAFVRPGAPVEPRKKSATVLRTEFLTARFLEM